MSDEYMLPIPNHRHSATTKEELQIIADECKLCKAGSLQEILSEMTRRIERLTEETEAIRTWIKYNPR